MDIGSILFILGLVIFVSLYISRPFFSHKATMVSQIERDLSVLYAEQERVLGSLQELDFDHTLGKIPEPDYPQQRAALLAQGVDILSRIDAIRMVSPQADLESRVQDAVASRKLDAERAKTASHRNGKRLIPVEAAPDDDLEAMIAARRRERMEKAAGFCPQCGKPVLFSDKFCSKCGASLAVDVTQTE